MDRLDCPDASLITAKRNTTITAIQALALLNNPFMVRQAEHLAARVQAAGAAAGRADRVDLPAGAGTRSRPRRRRSAWRDSRRSNGLENAARAILNSNEFLFVD